MADDEVGFSAERLAYVGEGLYELVAGLVKLLFIIVVGAWDTVRSRRSIVRGS